MPVRFPVRDMPPVRTQLDGVVLGEGKMEIAGLAAERRVTPQRRSAVRILVNEDIPAVRCPRAESQPVAPSSQGSSRAVRLLDFYLPDVSGLVEHRERDGLALRRDTELSQFIPPPCGDHEGFRAGREIMAHDATLRV